VATTSKMSNEKRSGDTEAVEAPLCNRRRVYRGEEKDARGWFDMLSKVRYVIISFVTPKDAGRLAIASKTHRGLLGSVPWQMCVPLKEDKCFPTCQYCGLKDSAYRQFNWIFCRACGVRVLAHIPPESWPNSEALDKLRETNEFKGEIRVGMMKELIVSDAEFKYWLQLELTPLLIYPGFSIDGLDLQLSSFLCGRLLSCHQHFTFIKTIGTEMLLPRRIVTIPSHYCADLGFNMVALCDSLCTPWKRAAIANGTQTCIEDIIDADDGCFYGDLHSTRVNFLHSLSLDMLKYMVLKIQPNNIVARNILNFEV
jgi:hypothetical protein